MATGDFFNEAWSQAFFSSILPENKGDLQQTPSSANSEGQRISGSSTVKLSNAHTWNIDVRLFTSTVADTAFEINFDAGVKTVILEANFSKLTSVILFTCVVSDTTLDVATFVFDNVLAVAYAVSFANVTCQIAESVSRR